MSAAVAVFGVADRISFEPRAAGHSIGGVAEMSRDALIAVTAAVLFCTSIGGALWYQGHSISMSPLTLLDRVLDDAVPTEALPGSPSDPAPNAQLPPIPPVLGMDEPDEDDSESPDPVAAKSAEETKSDRPKTTPTPADTFLADAPLPPVEQKKTTPTSKSTFPATAPNMPVRVSDQVAVPSPPPKPTLTALPTPAAPSLENLPTAAKEDLASDLEMPLPSDLELPNVSPNVSPSGLPSGSPAGSVETAREVPPSIPDLAQEEDSPAEAAAMVPTMPAIHADQPAKALKQAEPAMQLPGAPPMIVQTPAPVPVEPLPQKNESRSALPPAAALAEMQQEEPAAPAESLPPSNEAEPIAVAAPVKPQPIQPASAGTPRESVSVAKESAVVASPQTALPKIPAPKSPLSAQRSAPMDTIASTNAPAPPAALPTETETTETVAPAEVIAVTKPIVENAEGASITGTGVGEDLIAEAKAPSSSAKLLGTEPTAAPAEEYLPLNHRGEYVRLGQAANQERPTEEFVAVTSLPLGRHVLARGETAVTSQALKTDLSSDAPQVVSYDARSYLTLEGDSYKRISETMYHSTAYADALARYNHSTHGPHEQLPAGQRVRIPPADVLEREGAVRPREAFQRVDQLPYTMPSGSTNRVPPARASASGATADPANPFHPALAGDAPTTVGSGEYRSEQAQTLWAIASKELGDGRRWREIYTLNRDRLTNEIHVPAGTTLRMPKTGP